MEQFTPLTKAAFRDLIREAVQSRLSTALANTSQPFEAESEDAEEEVVTTPEEMEGFFIVRGIVREVIKPSRVFMRDQKSYCAILVDDNNRKPLARLHFNRAAAKSVGLFDAEKEERIRIETLDNIYDLADRLRATARAYVEGKKVAAAEASLAIEMKPADSSS